VLVEYLCKSNMLFDLREGGESFKDALARVDLPVLMIIDESDQLFTRNQAEEARSALPRGEVACYNSGNGHLSCIYETHHIEEPVREFINRGPVE